MKTFLLRVFVQPSRILIPTDGVLLFEFQINVDQGYC